MGEGTGVDRHTCPTQMDGRMGGETHSELLLSASVSLFVASQRGKKYVPQIKRKFSFEYFHPIWDCLIVCWDSWTLPPLPFYLTHDQSVL